MTLSNSTAFNPDIHELVDDAYELAGIDITNGFQLRSARFTINLLLLEWANKGHNLWTIEQISSSVLTTGTAEYEIPLDTTSIFDVKIRENDGLTNQFDNNLTRMSEITYAALTQKTTQGKPVQYLIRMHEIKGVAIPFGADPDRNSTITLWPVPESSTKYTLIYWRHRRMNDTGTGGAFTLEIPDRFMPAFVYALAYRLSRKSKLPEVLARAPGLEVMAAQAWDEATDNDRERATLRIVPKMYRV